MSECFECQRRVSFEHGDAHLRITGTMQNRKDGGGRGHLIVVCSKHIKLDRYGDQQLARYTS